MAALWMTCGVPSGFSVLGLEHRRSPHPPNWALQAERIVATQPPSPQNIERCARRAAVTIATLMAGTSCFGVEVI